MAIFTASQATQAVTSLASSTAATVYAALIDTYQGIFDLISQASALGKTSITWNLSRTDYTSVQPVLIDNGYTVSSWPAGITGLQHSTITIAWPSTSALVYPAITGITPSTIQGNQNIYFSCQFSVADGTAPYTFAITGSIPTGLAWSSLTNASSITLSGTPTQPANEFPGFTILATDSHGQTYSQAVSWTINATNIINVAVQPAGTNTLTFNANTGTLSFTPYLLPATTSTTLGGVIIPQVATSGINNTLGTIGVATASTTQLGAVRVDGTSIQVIGGVASIVATTTALDQRIRNIAIASAVAFGV
jgi:hypothetical protein